MSPGPPTTPLQSSPDSQLTARLGASPALTVTDHPLAGPPTPETPAQRLTAYAAATSGGALPLFGSHTSLASYSGGECSAAPGRITATGAFQRAAAAVMAQSGGGGGYDSGGRRMQEAVGLAWLNRLQDESSLHIPALVRAPRPYSPCPEVWLRV